MKRTLTLALLLGLTSIGCKEEAPAVPPIPIVPAANAPGAQGTAAQPGATAPTPAAAMPSIELSAEETTKLAVITAAIRDNGTVNGGHQREKTNANIFLHLAASGAQESHVIAGLRTLPNMWTNDEAYVSRGMTLITPAYAQTVLGKLSDASNPVQAAALKAAAPLLRGDTPNTDVVTKVVAMAASHPLPQGKAAAIDALYDAQLRANPDRLAPLVAALDAPEPWLVSTALFRGYSAFQGHPDKDAMQAKLMEVSRHADPGVRGYAAKAFASLLGHRDQARKPALIARLMEMLSDEHPFVKSSAMNALASLGHKPAIHEMIKLADDTTGNTYDITGWTQLDGSPGRSHHDGSAWSTVNDALFTALKTLTWRDSEKFEYEINYQTKDADLARVAGEAKAWYRAHRSEIPTE